MIKFVLFVVEFKNITLVLHFLHVKGIQIIIATNETPPRSMHTFSSEYCCQTGNYSGHFSHCAARGEDHRSSECI